MFSSAEKNSQKFLAIIFITSLFFSSREVFAVDITISTIITTPQLFPLDNQKLVVASGGNLTVSTAALNNFAVGLFL